MKFYESGIPGGRTILLLPGNFMTHRQFEHIAPLLAEEFRVVCVDFDGYDEPGETTSTPASIWAATSTSSTPSPWAAARRRS